MAPTYEELFEENQLLKKEVAQLRMIIEELKGKGTAETQKPDFVKDNQHHRHQKPGQKEGMKETQDLCQTT